MENTENELLEIGFEREDWIYEDEPFHEWVLKSNTSSFKIEVYEDFSASLVVGPHTVALPKSTGIEEIRALAKILCIV